MMCLWRATDLQRSRSRAQTEKTKEFSHFLPGFVWKPLPDPNSNLKSLPQKNKKKTTLTVRVQLHFRAIYEKSHTQVKWQVGWNTVWFFPAATWHCQVRFCCWRWFRSPVILRHLAHSVIVVAVLKEHIFNNTLQKFPATFVVARIPSVLLPRKTKKRSQQITRKTCNDEIALTFIYCSIIAL